MSKCLICGKEEKQKPMAFRGEEYCSDRHRKVLAGEIRPSDKESDSMSEEAILRLADLRRK